MSQSDLGELNLSITHSTNNVILTLEKVAMYLLTGSLILYNTGEILQICFNCHQPEEW